MSVLQNLQEDRIFAEILVNCQPDESFTSIVLVVTFFELEGLVSSFTMIQSERLLSSLQNSTSR